MATLTDVQKVWTLDDLADCHALLDMKQQQEKQAHEQMRANR